MIFSLPNYRRLSEADLARLRKDDKRTVSSWVANTLFNFLLLAALWGLPYYFCSLVLSKESDSANPRKAIIGVWRPAARGERDVTGYAIEFTRDGEFRLWRGGMVGLTAHYRFDEWGDVVLHDLDPPQFARFDHEEFFVQYRFTVTFTEEGLSVALPHREAAFRHGMNSGLPGPFGQAAYRFKRGK
jgi:hypothetical protein